ncbi:VCBS repeat-containing protein [Streptomyces sp. NPDC047108]|uniref:FG-GAP repeat domain-containing protein n=1 Tax=Streptomyces sp. NPDC047108 TaxID=3155025 RepID=UPI0033F358F3
MLGNRVRLATAVICLGVTAPLVAACSADGGKAAHSTSCPSPSKRADKTLNRGDVNGDGHVDVVVNGWYKVPVNPGLEWNRNRFVALATPDGLEPEAAFRLGERLPKLDQRISSGPVGHDQSHLFTGDLDDDGYADVIAGDPDFGSHGKIDPRQRILWGGPDGPCGTTKLPTGIPEATHTGDFDGDGALDLLTLARPSSAQPPDRPQRATVLYGPLSHDGATPRTRRTIDVGHDGWVSVRHTVVGDFDGDGRDDLVTKGEYGEEDSRLENGVPKDAPDATFYRGTPGGLKPAGTVPGITGSAGALPLAAGDFDGDDRQDILARAQDDGQDEGRALVVHGSSEGPGRGKPGAGDLGTLKGGLDAAVGDTNGDGYDDIATRSRGEGRRYDRVVVALGGKDGLSATRTVTIGHSALDPDGSARRPAWDDDFFGWDLQFADVDADDRDDVLISTYGSSEPRKDAGYWILRGTADGPSTTDARFVKTKGFGRS